jgi:hypothetical protein
LISNVSPAAKRVGEWQGAYFTIDHAKRSLALLREEQCVARRCFKGHLNWRAHMPILLWLIGVPISIIVLLMLFGVLHI